MNKHDLRYLALGDSYTIGEALPLADSFPNQLVHLLMAEGFTIQPAAIVARTGWTTQELMQGILEAEAGGLVYGTYDIVTLLIGVNDQYRGLPMEEYEPAFTALLDKALLFAGNKRDAVVVLSIPDWGVTPFAKDRDRAQVAHEINAYNRVNRTITEARGIHYITVTEWTREAANNPGLVAADGLHPSGLEYARWARHLLSYIKQHIV